MVGDVVQAALQVNWFTEPFFGQMQGLDLYTQLHYITAMATKTIAMQVRVSEAEAVAFSDAADLAGMRLSAWVRSRLRVDAARELREEGRPVAFLEGGLAGNGQAKPLNDTAACAAPSITTRQQPAPKATSG